MSVLGRILTTKENRPLIAVLAIAFASILIGGAIKGKEGT